MPVLILSSDLSFVNLDFVKDKVYNLFITLRKVGGVLVIKRGDIYFVDLGETNGSEQGGVRPCVVISNNKNNKYSPNVIVAMMSRSGREHLPTHVEIAHQSGLKYRTFVKTEHIRTISKGRLGNFAGRMSTHNMKKVDEAIEISIF